MPHQTTATQQPPPEPQNQKGIKLAQSPSLSARGPTQARVVGPMGRRPGL